jgi:CRP-like cAMP-binding protein
MKPAAIWPSVAASRGRTTDPVPSTAERTTLMAGSDEARALAGAVAPVLAEPGYLDEGEIGVGGSGSIRRMLDSKLQRRVAMKMLWPRLAARPHHVERFLREAQIVAQLDHPNIPPIHELAFDGRGRPYFTMKLVQGQTLHKLVPRDPSERGDAESLLGLLSVFLKVCEAVSFAHSLGIWHCDIKPENIMVGAFGEAYLMDWGIASTRESTRTADLPAATVESGRRPNIRGTPAYMAPEQAAGATEAIGECTDVFGLGTVLYFIVAGVSPFKGRDTSESLERARQNDLIPSERLAPQAPPALHQIIRKAMAVRPQERHASVAELRQELEEIVRGTWHLPTRTFAAGARIVVEGEPGDAAFVILSGTCLVTKRAGKRRQTVRRLGPGEVFGEAAVLSGRPRTASVEAVSQVTVRVVTREVLEREFGVGTDLGKFVLALTERFCQMDAKLARLEAQARRRRRKAAERSRVNKDARLR